MDADHLLVCGRAGLDRAGRRNGAAAGGRGALPLRPPRQGGNPTDLHLGPDLSDERWRPDEALLAAVRTRSLEIRDLSGPDRSWVVAGLAAQGWTVAAIADRLRCSLRLVQAIKAEPMTRVTVYAMDLAAQLASGTRFWLMFVE
jgi:hypothetical protein